MMKRNTRLSLISASHSGNIEAHGVMDRVCLINRVMLTHAGLAVALRPDRDNVSRSRGGCGAHQTLPTCAGFSVVVGDPGQTKHGTGTRQNHKHDDQMPAGSHNNCETHAWLPQAHSREREWSMYVRRSTPGAMDTVQVFADANFATTRSASHKGSACFLGGKLAT